MDSAPARAAEEVSLTAAYRDVAKDVATKNDDAACPGVVCGGRGWYLRYFCQRGNDGRDIGGKW